jgi:hypothetical protein
MSAPNNIRSIASAALLTTVVGLLATACGSQTGSQDAFDVTGEVAEERIYPPTDVPVQKVPDRIYPPSDVPVIEYP